MTGTSADSRMRGSRASNSGLRRAGRSRCRLNGARNAAPIASTIARLLKRCIGVGPVGLRERARRLLELEPVQQVVVARLRVIAPGGARGARRAEPRQQ